MFTGVSDALYLRPRYGAFRQMKGEMPMKRFEDDRYYPTTAPELGVLCSRGTLAQWRHRGVGPPYIRFGNRVLYKGRDLNEWLDERRVETAA